MLTTYADQFTPRSFGRITQAAGATPITAFTPRDAAFDTSGAQQVADQVKHFRLWAYIAVDANSTKAAEAFPNVGLLRAAGKSRNAQRAIRWGALSAGRRQFLAARYPRIAQSMQYGGAELEPAPPQHPLIDLFRRVNQYGDWWQTFAYETFMFLQLTGQFVWWLIPSGLRSEFGVIPAELVCVPPQWAKAIYSKSGDLTKWEIKPYGDNRAKFDLPPDQIIEGKRKNPQSKSDAYSALAAGTEWVKNSEFIEKARHLLYKHGNLQSFLIEMDPEFHENVTPELLERVRDQFMQKIAGGVSQVHRPVAVPPGLKLSPMSLKPSEMLTDSAAEQMRDFVLALFRTPKGVVGMSQDYNKANIDGINLIWCEHTICPLQGFLAGCMTEKLGKRFGEDVVCWYEDCRPMDSAEERAETQLDWLMGAVSPDERRVARGRDPLNTEASQSTYVPASVMPLEIATEVSESDAFTDQEKKRDQETEDQRAGVCPVHGAVHQNARERRIARSFHRLHAAHERNSLSSLRKMWLRVKRDVLARVDKHGSETSAPSVTDLLPRGEFRELFNKTMRPHWLRMVQTGVDFEADMLGIEFEKQRVRQAADEDEELPDISVEYPEALKRKMQEYLKDRAVGVWEHVIESTHSKMRDAIQKSLEAGEHIREIRKRLEDALDVTRNQAVRIARTETTASLNYGGQALRETEDIPQKQWIATVDSDTRPSHDGANHQIVANDKPFTVGGHKMMHPGDSSLGAPAEEIVSCRCTATGYVEL